MNPVDVETAISSPRKIQYVEETLREMEAGNLKIRVRSLENEKALERMALTQGNMMNLLMASVALNVGIIASSPIITGVCVAGAVKFGVAVIGGNAKIKKVSRTSPQVNEVNPSVNP